MDVVMKGMNVELNNVQLWGLGRRLWRVGFMKRSRYVEFYYTDTDTRPCWVSEYVFFLQH